jgi:hypothetical protein
MWVGKHGPCNFEQLVEAHCKYQDRECLGECNRVIGDVDIHGDGECSRSVRLAEGRLTRGSQNEELSQQEQVRRVQC